LIKDPRGTLSTATPSTSGWTFTIEPLSYHLSLVICDL
jgi:hypothetical protein